ncbi:MAG TPA: hypothetical protein VGF28_07500 [Thermoanaerobaculia bacterium]|jgi:hypothetical protein
MKRWPFNLAAAFSLLLSLTIAAAWATSYAQPRDWHLLGLAHSAGLTRVDLDRRGVVVIRVEADVRDLLDYLCGVSVHQEVFFLWRPFLRDAADDMIVELAVAAGVKSS